MASLDLHAKWINTAPPTILYIDLDSCFATAEQQANPLLRGKPVIVGAYTTDNGCILSPSIEAKRLGIKTGMRVFEAKQIEPRVIVCAPDPPKYRDIHHKFCAILEEYSPTVIAKSIDEAVVDFSGMSLTTQRLVAIGQEIKQRIRREIGEWISSSIGIATNRNLAKLGASLDKPDGLLAITADNLTAVYARTKLQDFAGINTASEMRLHAYGIRTPLDFFHASWETLQYKVFKSIIGFHWYLRLRGWEVDAQEHERKSYGQQYSLHHHTNNIREIEGIVLKLTEKMGRRLRKAGYSARGIHIGSLFTDHTGWNWGKTFDRCLYTTAELYREIRWLLSHCPTGKTFTFLSVTSFNLLPSVYSQLELFSSDKERQRRISAALDRINDRFGEYTAFPATMMDMDDRVIDRVPFGMAGIGQQA